MRSNVSRSPRGPRGRLKREMVTIQKPSLTKGDYAESVPSFASYGVRAARIVGRGGKETQRANQTVPEADYLVELWSDELSRELTTRYRILWNGKVLGIVHVDTTRAHEGEVVCFCESRDE